MRPQDAARLGALFERLEFTRLLRRVRGERAAAARPLRAPHPRPRSRRRSAAAARPAGRYETVVTTAELERWCERIAAAPLVALDTETTSLAYMRAELVGISLAVTPGEAAYIPLAHRYPGAPDQLNREAVLERLKPWLESTAPKVGHHLKYDAHIFANHGIALRGIEHDTMLESYVLNSTATRHDMDSVAALYLGIATMKYEEVVGKGAKQITFDQVDLDTATRYCRRGRRRRAAAAPSAVAEVDRRARPRRASIPTSSGRSCACSSKWSTPASWSMRACCASRAKSSPRRWPRPRKPRTPRRAGRSTWARRSNCKRCCTSGSSCPCSARRRKASRRRPRTCSSSSPKSYELPRLVLEYRGLTKLKSTYTDKLPIGHRSKNQAHPYVVPSSRRGDGPAVVVGPESAEHSDSHGRRPPDPAGVHCTARLQAAGRRLLADRAQDHGALVGRRGLARRLRERPRRPSRHGGRGVQHAARRGYGRSAPLGESHQLRAHLRHVGVRPRQAARHRARPSAGLRRSLLRALPGRASLHGPDARQRAAARLRHAPYSAGACTCPKSTRATRSCANTPSAAPSTRRCRERPPTSSSAR